MPRTRKKRKGNAKSLLPVIHIFCEGEKTEPIYINGYVEKYYPENRRLKIINVKKTKKNTPIQLVDEAKKLKAENSLPKNDQIWVVYDRESSIKYIDSLHKRALVTARANGIEVALSNICFELWILLHLDENVRAPYESCDDLIKNSALKEKLKEKGIKSYSKADRKVFEVISGNIDEARKRAKSMNQATLSAAQDSEDNPHRLNPYTRVGELLDAIDEIAKKAGKKSS